MPRSKPTNTRPTGAAKKQQVLTLPERAKALKARSLAAKKQKCDELVDLVRRRQARIVEDFYDIGEALRTILREKLYESYGEKSFAAFLDTVDLVPRATAMRLIAIVDHVPRTQALRLGQEKSYALVAYTEATPHADKPAELAKADAKIARKPISKASVRDLQEATKAARTKAGAKKAPTPPQRARAKQRQAAEQKTRAFFQKLGIRRPKLEATTTGVRVELSYKDLDQLPS